MSPTDTSNEASTDWETPSHSPNHPNGPSTPRNTPSKISIYSKPIKAKNLTAALEKSIEEIEKLNAYHRFPPRKSGRTNLFGGSYNYNRRKRGS